MISSSSSPLHQDCPSHDQEHIPEMEGNHSCRRRSRCSKLLTTTMLSITTIMINSQTANAFSPSIIHPHTQHRPHSSPSSSHTNLPNLISSSATSSSSTSSSSPSSLGMISAFDTRGDQEEMSDFQRRMRKLVNGQQPTKRNRSTIKKKKSKAPDNLVRIDTLEEYKRVVGGAKDDKLVAVRFFAPWCKACKAIAPSFYRLSVTYPDILFVDVPVTPENANLHQGLGVPSLPFGHIYHPEGGLVEELRISKKYFPAFARALKSYSDGSCSIAEDETD